MRCIQSCARLTIAVCYLSCHVPADFIRNRRLLCCAALRCKSGDLLLFGGRVWLQPIAKGWLWPQGQEGQPIIWLSHVCAAARKRYCAAPRHPLLQQQESSGASSVSRTRTQTTLCIPDTICTAHGMGWTTSHINTRADGGATNGSTVTSTDGMHVCLLSTLKKTPPPPHPPPKVLRLPTKLGCAEQAVVQDIQSACASVAVHRRRRLLRYAAALKAGRQPRVGRPFSLATAASMAASPPPPGVGGGGCGPGAGAGPGAAASWPTAGCWPKGVFPNGVATTGKAAARGCPNAGAPPAGGGVPNAPGWRAGQGAPPPARPRRVCAVST